MAVLQHHSQGTPQIRLFDLININAVIADLAVLDVVKPVNQVRDRRLSGSGRAHEGHLLAWLRVKPDIMKDDLILRIAKVHAVHHHLALQLRVGQGSVMVGMLPGPEAGSLGNLLQLSVLPADVHQGHIAVVLLRGLIQKAEDTLRSGKSHDDGVELLGDLGDRLVETPGQLQEGGQAAQRQAAYVSDGKKRSHNGRQHIVDISDIGHHGHQNIGEDVGVAGAVEQLIVQLLEPRLGLLLVAEDLYDLLAVHHFLDIAVYNTDVALLGHKIAPRLAADLFRHLRHDEYHQQHQHRQNRTEHQHGDKDADDGNRRGQKLRDALAYHLPQSVRIIGVNAHQIPVGMGVEKRDGEGLHVLKHLIPDLL